MTSRSSSSRRFEDRLPSEAVVEAIAAREGVDAAELDVPLFDAIDPEALDSLVRYDDVRHHPSPLQFEFTYHGYAVRVSSDGSIDLSPDA